MTISKRGRSDWRTQPKDYDAATGLSFEAYLTGPYTRGFDWLPDKLPAGLMRIHEARPEGGAGPLRPFFLRWIDGDLRSSDPQPMPGVTHDQVRRAIARASARHADILAVLLWRQEPSNDTKRTPRQVMDQYGITSSTLARRKDKAVRLVAEELEADLNGQRYADEGA